jgi:Sulfotransferase domain
MKSYFLFFLLWIAAISAEPKEFALVTPMKTGTHMTKDLLIKLTGKNPRFISRDFFHLPQGDIENVSFEPSDNKLFFSELAEFKKENCFAFSHSILALPYSKYARKNKDFVVITNYRDLRDAVVSYVYYLEENGYFKDPNLTFDEKLTHCIKKYTNQVIPLPVIKRIKNIFIIKYEDLVGYQGGGTDEGRCECVIKLCEKIGLIVSASEIQQILTGLYGTSGTFRKGKIGEWKTHFKEEHKRCFKSTILGQALIEMGYEQNNEW